MKEGAENVEDSTEDSTEDTSEPKEDTAKADGSGFTYILMGIAAVAVIGVVYVVKSAEDIGKIEESGKDEELVKLAKASCCWVYVSAIKEQIAERYFGELERQRL